MAELGYELRTEFQGQGIACEAVGRLLNLLLKLRDLIAWKDVFIKTTPNQLAYW